MATFKILETYGFMGFFEATQANSSNNALSKLARLSVLIGKKYAKQSGVALLLLYMTPANL